MLKTITDLIRNVAPSRAHRGAWLLVNMVAVVVAFIPLFNLVGYESAALFGGVLGLCAAGLTVHLVRTGRVSAPWAAERERSPAADFGRLALMHLAMAAGPLSILIVNGVRVPNCDWAAGFGFWGLIVVPAILIGQTAGWVAVTLFAHRRFTSWIVAFGLPVASGVALAAHLALQPPIVGHQWLIGYFSGSIYDEALAVPSSLIAYRIINIAAVVAVVSIIEVVWRFRDGRRWRWTAALAVVAAIIFSAGYSHRADFGIEIDRGYIVDELGGSVETEHFVIYYPDQSRFIDEIDQIIEEHEYRYAQLREFFGTDPVAEHDRRVKSFIYPSRDEKARLMGGRNTMVAKLWLHEMHLMWRGPNSDLLAHELAHIFTEPFGSGPLRLSMQHGIGVNMGLVEGAAVAAEWPAGTLNPHQATSAMRSLDIDPRIDQILTAGGFWTEASGPAYVAMGSFVRYLVDKKGIEPFKQAYPTGDFESAYGMEVDELVANWEAFVDDIEVTERQKIVAEDRYDRPSIFGRDCARAIAEVRRRARSAAARGAFGEAKYEYEQLKRLDPDNASVWREYARLLFDHHQPDRALAVIEQRPQVAMTRADEAQFMELKGDVLWAMDKPQQAVDSYDQALRAGASVDRERSLRVRRHLAERDELRGRRYLVEVPGETEGIYLLSRWLAEDSDDAVAQYLMGRRLWQKRLYTEAIEYLEPAYPQLTVAVLDGEAGRMLGQSYYFEGRFDDARSIWRRLAGSDVDYYAAIAEEWLPRTEWARRNTK